MHKVIEIGDTRLDTKDQCFYVKNKPLNLSPQEYLIVEYVILRRNRIWNQEDLKTYLFEYTYYGAKPRPQSSSWLAVQMINIRKKIKKVGGLLKIEGKQSIGGYSVYSEEVNPAE